VIADNDLTKDFIQNRSFHFNNYLWS
jgi:hypothetical protein